MMLGPHEQLACRVSAKYFARTVLDMELDDWQSQLAHDRRYGAALCGRQVGKSTVGGVAACWLMTAVEPGCLVVTVSPSQRQSGELARTITKFCDEAAPQFGLRFVERNRLSIELSNGSRHVALPGSDSTIRGLSRVRMLLMDEAAFCDPQLLSAIRPFLAVGSGRLVLLSSPGLMPAGEFYDITTSPGPNWRVWTVPSTDCARIPQSFLDAERADMSEATFDREYRAMWVNISGKAMFNPDQIRAITKPRQNAMPPSTASLMGAEVDPAPMSRRDIAAALARR